ncbi:hypothetical protein BC829DRAFT_432277 [Chytridium lagenaria]|nr:hypothetical protein BC829DRAFT_432277 [Chytridium lagenaria]
MERTEPGGHVGEVEMRVPRLNVDVCLMDERKRRRREVKSPRYSTLSQQPNHPSPSPPTLLDASSSSSAGYLHTFPPQQPQSWESLRRQARQLENDVESKLVNFARLGSALAGNGSGSSGMANTSVAAGNWASAVGLQREIEELLRKLTEVVDGMASCLDGPNSSPSNPPMMHTLQRHRDILYDFSKEFKKTKANIAAAKDHSELLGSIRDDISSYRPNNTEDLLLNERSKIDGSHKLADIVLEQAYETRDALNLQGRMLSGTRGRVAAALSKFPAINNLFTKINTKKRKDTPHLGWRHQHLYLSFAVINVKREG